MKTYIYLVTNVSDNQDETYVGKTINPLLRNKDHKKTYGEQIIFEIIDEIDSIERKDWEPLETYWMEQIQQRGLKLVNIRKKGGGGPEYCSKEHKAKIGLANSKPKPEDFGRKHSLKLKGIPKGPKTLEHCNKISKALMLPIIQYDKKDNYIKEWESASTAALSLGKKSGAAITECCRGKRKTIYGYKWKLKM